MTGPFKGLVLLGDQVSEITRRGVNRILFRAAGIFPSIVFHANRLELLETHLLSCPGDNEGEPPLPTRLPR